MALLNTFKRKHIYRVFALSRTPQIIQAWRTLPLKNFSVNCSEGPQESHKLILSEES